MLTGLGAWRGIEITQCQRRQVRIALIRTGITQFEPFRHSAERCQPDGALASAAGDDYYRRVISSERLGQPSAANASLNTVL
jgi:hypothetical protein